MSYIQFCIKKSTYNLTVWLQFCIPILFNFTSGFHMMPSSCPVQTTMPLVSWLRASCSPSWLVYISSCSGSSWLRLGFLSWLQTCGSSRSSFSLQLCCCGRSWWNKWQQTWKKLHCEHVSQICGRCLRCTNFLNIISRAVGSKAKWLRNFWAPRGRANFPLNSSSFYYFYV